MPSMESNSFGEKVFPRNRHTAGGDAEVAAEGEASEEKRSVRAPTQSSGQKVVVVAGNTTRKRNYSASSGKELILTEDPRQAQKRAMCCKGDDDERKTFNFAGNGLGPQRNIHGETRKNTRNLLLGKNSKGRPSFRKANLNRN